MYLVFLIPIIFCDVTEINHVHSSIQDNGIAMSQVILWNDNKVMGWKHLNTTDNLFNYNNKLKLYISLVGHKSNSKYIVYSKDIRTVWSNYDRERLDSFENGWNHRIKW